MKKIILFLLFLILISFKTGDNKSNYTVPRAAYSVTAGDIDMDGDNDIVVGHTYSSQTNWTGISVLSNDGFGSFISDSNYVNGQHRKVELQQLNLNEFPDLVTQAWNNINSQIGIVFDSDFTQSNILTINIIDYADYIVTGDVNNDNHNDIIFASNNGQFWGVLYNDGSGNFSIPEYHYVTEYYPTDIACGDLNNDGRDDIVVCGQSTEVFFSYPGGFQSLLLETDDFKQDVSIVDFDLDGDLDIVTFVDIYLANYTRLKIYENIGNNNFDTIANFDFQPSCSIMFVTDFNNDSLPDVIFHTSTGAFIFYNQDDFQMSDPKFVEIPDIGEDWRNSYCADMDGNGYNDIITLRCSFVHMENNLSILFNDGNGNFQENPIVNIQPSNIELQKSNLSCYPNPSRSFGTTIIYEITKQANIKLKIYDLNRKLIKTYNEGKKSEGIYKIVFNTNGLPTGMYFYSLYINGVRSDSKKMIVE
jgi:hypothetical protein